MKSFVPALILAAAAVPFAPAQPHSRSLQGPPWTMHVIDDQDRGADGTKLADVNGDDWPDVTTGWEEAGETRVYLNPGPNGDVKGKWPRVVIGRTPSSEDAVFVDLDGDGALDVVSATEGGSCQVFVHWGPTDRSRLLETGAWTQEVIPVLSGVGAWMFVQPLQFDGRHGNDLILGSKPGRETHPAAIGWLEAPARPRDLAAWKWHRLADAGWVMSIEPVDMDGDGDQDILYSDRKGPTRGVYWLESPGAEAIARGVKPARHRVNAAEVHEVMFLTLGDVDGDGRQDIVAGIEEQPRDRATPNQHSRVRWFKRLDDTGRKWSEHTLAVPANTGNIKAVAVGDMDGDGRPDIVVTCENSQADRRGVYWLRQGATTANQDWNAFDISGVPGTKYDLVRLLDLDGDGDLDVLTNEESDAGRGLGVMWYENPVRTN